MRRGAPLEVGRAAPVAQAEPEPPLRTTFSFVLPRGYVDPAGVVHKHGVMRLATARDELLPLQDERVRQNPNYLTVVLLSRVVTKLGGLEDRDIHPHVVDEFFASDLAFLQDLYRRINTEGHTRAAVTCPSCQHDFTVDLGGDAPGGW